MKWLQRVSRHHLAWIALFFAALTLLGINVLASEKLRTLRADLTQGKLFTISGATRDVLAKLDEPVYIKLYYTNKLGEVSPAYARHAGRVRNLLHHYADLAGGKLVLEIIEPEPFSSAEDRAVAAGLRGVPLGGDNGTGYLGVVGTNSTDDQKVLAFLTTERQNFLEYDLTKLVHQLANPARKKIGIMTSLPLAGGFDPQRGQVPAWLINQQMKEFFDVEMLANDSKAIEGIDVLFLAAPGRLSENTLYAIEQFALSGKPVVAFLDTFSEASQRSKVKLGSDDPLHKLLKAWGVQVSSGKVVADIGHARQVQYQAGLQPVVANYVVWLEFPKGGLDEGNALFSSVNNLVMASPANLEPVEGAETKFEAILRTSTQGMLVDVAALAQPDPLTLLQNYAPGGKALTIAARVTGPAKTAYPDGAPKAATGGDASKEGDGKKAEQTPSAKEHLKTGDVNIMVVGDSDMLFDRFWAQVRSLAGQQFIVPVSGNADFLLNTLEIASGGAALSGLRGRGVETRPFTRVLQIRQQAETRYRRRERVLNTKLEQTTRKLGEIQSRAQDGNVILSEQDKTAILGFREEIVSIRQDLRGVQRALRKDIEQLETTVKVANIAGVPLAIGFGALVFVFIRRRKAV